MPKRAHDAAFDPLGLLDNDEEFPFEFPFLDELDEGFCCPICSDIFQAPKELPCGHLFCSACIHRWLEQRNKGII